MPRGTERDPLTTRVGRAAQERVSGVADRADQRIRTVTQAADDRIREVTQAAEERLARAMRTRDAVLRTVRPGRRRHLDTDGWSTGEWRALQANPHVAPPLRAGHATVRLTNTMGDVLPVEGTLLARAVADAAPPLGAEVSAMILDILERYLPDTLIAYRNSAAATTTRDGQRRIVEHLRLLHQVTRDVQRAQAEHDDRELLLQETFLKERFGVRPNVLDLSPTVKADVDVDAVLANGLRLGRVGVAPHQGAPHQGEPAQGNPTQGNPALDGTGAPGEPSALAASTGSHHRLLPEVRPTAIFRPDADSRGSLRLRMALPKGMRVTLGVISQTRAGAIHFTDAAPRRFGGRRRHKGFDAAQVDVALDLPLGEISRFVVHVASHDRGEPVESVLFATEGSTNSAELPALLTHQRRSRLTVVASGHATSDGLFLRNESSVFGTLRAICDGYGYTDITWLSEDTPAV